MATLSALCTYPIKSCAGVALATATCPPEGLEHDRRWMVVDDRGEFLTQREAPRLALITPSLRSEVMRIAAPGMLRIELPLEVEEDDPTVLRKVTVWGDVVEAVDEGDYVAQWLSDFLGRRARLVKLHPDARRVVHDVGDPAAHRFADACPLLVVGQASLDDLNLRLAAAGVPEVPMNRFRPNVVIAGLEAYAEDRLEALQVDGVTLSVVRSCVRCEIPDIDQATADRSREPTNTLATYRADPALSGAITFGVYCVVTGGAGGTLSVGDEATLRWRVAP